MDKQYFNIYGGLNLSSTNETISQTEKLVEWKSAKNVEIQKGIGIVSMLGNINILETVLPEGTKILGGFEYKKGDESYNIVNTSEGSFYELENGELGTALKEDLDEEARCNYCNFGDVVIITNGVDAVFSYGKDAVTPVNDISQAPKGLAIASYKNRVFIGKDSTLYYSALGDHTDWVTSNDAGSMSNFFNDSSPIIGLETYKDFLVIYKENANYYLSGSSPADFTIGRLGDTGCNSTFGIVTFDYGKQYFFNPEGIYPVEAPGKDKNNIAKKILPAFDELENSNFYALPYVKNNQIWFYFQKKLNTYIDCAYIYDYVNEAWLYRELPQDVVCAWLFRDEIYLGTADGKILQENYGDDFDGEDINPEIQFPDFHLGEAFKRKIIEGFRIKFSSHKNNRCNVYLKFDNDDSTERSYNITAPQQDNVLIWDVGKWDINLWWKSIDFAYRSRASRRFYTISPSVRATSGAFCFRGFEYENIQLES